MHEDEIDRFEIAKEKQKKNIEWKRKNQPEREKNSNEKKMCTQISRFDWSWVCACGCVFGVN